MENSTNFGSAEQDPSARAGSDANGADPSDAPTQTTLVEQDATLVANGYAPIAVMGKRPVANDWQKRPDPAAAIIAEREAFPGALSTGLLCGVLAPVDIDLVEWSDAFEVGMVVRNLLGDTDMERIGAKGTMLCYRNRMPIKKITVGGAAPDGTKQKVEFLAEGQQFVAYGIHPDTGKAYRWHNVDDGAEPLHRKLSELIEVTPDQLRQCAQAVAAKLIELGYTGVKVTGDIDCPSETDKPDKPTAPPTGDPVSVAILRDMLRHLDPNCDRDLWLRLVAALRAAPLPDDEDEAIRRDLAHEWSRGALHDDLTPSNYKSSKDVDAMFEDMPPKPDNPKAVHFGTLVHAAKEAGYTGPAQFRDPAARLGKHHVSPPPRDLFGMLTPEPVLTRDMLPDVIANFAFDRAERMGVVPQMIALPAIVTSAACLHDGFTIAPLRLDRTFMESARLWACLVCGVSDLKTPALKAALEPLWNIHLERAAAYKQKFTEYKTALESWKTGRKQDQATFGKVTPEPEPPIKSKLITTDPTMESVAKILANNPQGILIHRDELAGWISSFDAYHSHGGGKDRTLALELYNGGPKTFDRVERDVDVSNWSASVVGTIQNDKLRSMAPKLEDDGFLQRFILVPGGRMPTGGQDREPDYGAESAYRTLVRQLVERDPGTNRPPVRLSSDARPYWNEVTQLGHALADMPGVPAALVGFLNKITGNFARLLLTFHAITQMANNAEIDDDVSGDTARRARDLMVRFIFPAAERVYAECFSPSDDGLQAVRWVAGHILAHKYERFTDRDFYRAAHHKDGLFHPENDRLARKRAMDTLVVAGWAYPDGDTAWKINQQIYVEFAERGAAERSRRDAAIERIKRAGEAMKKSYGKSSQ
jgi:hypothetical protein